jgi:cytochrome P450
MTASPANAFAPQRADDAPLYPPRVVPPKQPLGLLPFVYNFIQNPLAVMPEAVYETAMVARERARAVWITDPDLVKAVLLDRREEFPKSPLERRVLGPLLGDGILIADGPAWRWQRQIAAPLFRHQDLIDDVPAMTRAAEATIADWRSAPAGTVHAIDLDMTRATYRVISDTLLPGDEALGEVFERQGREYLHPISWSMVYALFDVPAWLPHPGRRAMRRAEVEMRGIVAELIRRRRAATEKSADLLQRLIDARHPETKEPMSDTQLVDNVLTFYAAGHETTAKALTWTLYLLALAPQWAERIAGEVEAVTGGAPVGPAHIDKLVVTAQVVKEGMRLYPPAPVISRVTSKALELGGKTLAAGTQVVVPIWAIQRHRKLWADPDRFDPARFAPDKEKAISRYQYMPFGAGPRICIGMAFAMLEATAMLATFVRAARFAPVSGYEPEPVSRVTLRPKRGMPLGVTLR